MLSPFLKMKSPGAEWIMSKPTARDRRQPSEAKRKAGQSLNTCLKCTNKIMNIYRKSYLEFFIESVITCSNGHKYQLACLWDKPVKTFYESCNFCMKMISTKNSLWGLFPGRRLLCWPILRRRNPAPSRKDSWALHWSSWTLSLSWAFHGIWPWPVTHFRYGHRLFFFSIRQSIMNK